MSGKPPRRRLPWWKKLLLVVLALVLLAVGFVLYTNVIAKWASRGRLFDDIDALPYKRVALIFGCTNRIDGRENLYFRYRIDAAERLWKAGKAKCFIVSGDNRTRYYNEPLAMREALQARGIPADRIIEDYAGLSTLDSVVRAKEIFGVTEITFVSQRFQSERGVYLAEANGMDAVGFNAEDVKGQGGWKTKSREVAARVKMWLDVHLWNTQPHHLGSRIALPE